MPARTNDFRCTLSQCDDFDEIIDVRSPSEFIHDHIPGALNFPVLNDRERHEIGLLYAESPFEARKIGAAIVARNIAQTIERHLYDRPKNWRPLVYCWRGGMRSQSTVIWLRLIGWHAGQLVGGYKTWRRHVLAELAAMPARFRFRVICGATGSAKTRLLHALAGHGEQVLDLEALAAHKGSVLGELPNEEQPSQKWFDTLVYEKLLSFDPARAVYVEAESKKIGRCTVPAELINIMHQSECIEINTSLNARLDYLLKDYAYLGDDHENLCRHLSRLKGYIDNVTLEHWQTLAYANELRALFSELIIKHYDPLYARSQHKHFAALKNATRISVDDLSHETLHEQAQLLVHKK